MMWLIACAGADQLTASLGIWKHGIIPGILSTEVVAEDVHKEHLDFLLQHREIEPDQIEAILLNAKGFGGNNATASLLSPFVTQRMLKHKHGAKAIGSYQARNEKVAAASDAYEELGNSLPINPIYKFDHKVREGNDLAFTENGIEISGESMLIDLQLGNPYSDMCEQS